MRVDAKVDGNQDRIVRDLRKLGATIAYTYPLGKGAADILVGYKGVNYWFEIKDPAQPARFRKLTPDEKKLHETWQGQIAVVEETADCLKIFHETNGREPAD